MKKFSKKIAVVILLAAIMLPVSVWPEKTYSKTQAELQQELAEIEKQIAEQEKQLQGISGTKQTLQNKLNELKTVQDSLRLQIKSTNLKIQQLDGQIDETEGSITEASDRLESLKPKLAELIRQVHEQEKRPLLVSFFLNDDLTTALDEIGRFQEVSAELLDIGQNMRDLKANLEEKQVVLEEQQEGARQMLAIQGLQENEFAIKVDEQNNILQLTAAQEAEYQAILSQTRQQAASIRARIFELAGDTEDSVTFGEAVEIAKWASGLTGVRTALLLAVLTQESNLGKNVGQCYMTDPQTANGINVRTGSAVSQVMKPMGLPGRRGDVEDFLKITQELGRDPYATPVSCPIARVGGYGGAMGPAQFIPTTWVGYKDRVSALTGRPADPWNIYDAFLASGIKLAAGGATKDGENGEWKAAMRYFSGGTNVRYRFYGDNVLALARRYQAELDALGG